MAQVLSLRQLADKLVHVEQEMTGIRQELAVLRQEVKTAPRAPVAPFEVASLWADKRDQRRWIRDLFVVLSIQGTPIGTERLQQQMAWSGLASDELSRDLVEAREE